MMRICKNCGCYYWDLDYETRRNHRFIYIDKYDAWFCCNECLRRYENALNEKLRRQQEKIEHERAWNAERESFKEKHNRKIQEQQEELKIVREQSINIEGFLFSPDRKTLIQCPKLTRDYTVPEGVIEIFAEAFKGCERLEKVILPQGLKIIGREAFANCTALKSIEFSEGLEEIGELTFYNCKSLTSLTFPASLKLIDGRKEADYAASINMEVISYYYGAFIGCDNLEEVTISGKETIIGDYAFWKCRNLQKLNGTGKVVGNYAFSDCYKLTNVIFSDSTEEILDEAFARTAINGPVDLPAIKVIGETAFRLCPLTSINIGKEIAEIRDKAFAYCGKLEDTEDDPDSGTYSCDSDLVLDFGYDGEKPCGKGCLQNIHFPETVKEIKSNWFEDSGVKSLTISASVESFEIDNRIIKTIYIENGVPSGELRDQLSQYDVVVKQAGTNKVIIEGKYIPPVSKESESKSDSGGKGFLGLFGKKKR